MKRRILYHLREGKYIGSATFMLFQEPVDDLGLGFLFGEAECHELDELIAGDLADGGLAVSMGSYPMDGSWMVPIQIEDKSEVFGGLLTTLR